MLKQSLAAKPSFISPHTPMVMHGSMFVMAIANGIGVRPMDDSEWTCGSFPDEESGILL
jgi:hypothetical protein